MLTKFETKSKRVKGLSFHKHRPWVLASLHNGSIHLFDYRAQVLLDKFDDHNGPVRGIAFHETQPMFVSGGDDNHVKVWNYKMKKCLFTLQGHLDYVRTVEFHRELPWIISASDDQTVRIWNWQNRSIVAILTGHSHYVMCATFHPEDTLIASCSLDMTVRVWDFFKLKEKVMNKAGSRPGELFGGTEVEVKHILEGHDKGVNWVTFHPSMKILASAADDKTIKLWRLSGNKHWEMDTLKGHTNNVSCVMFHPRMEILLSNSEDRTMRFWDLNRRVQIHQTRKDTDRYWILAAHPTLNYFAAGYDNGMNVFKLERERHASVRIGPNLFYVKNKNFYIYDLKHKSKNVICPVNTSGKQVLLNQPTQIYYNSFNNASHNFLMHFDVEGGAFAIFEVDRDIRNGDAKLLAEKKGEYCLACVFISKDRIAVLDTNREVTVGNFDGSNTKKWPIVRKGMTKIDMIFPAYVGKILVQADDTLFMYDMSARKVTFEIAIADVKRVVWTPQFTHAVIMTKHQILVVNKSLQVLNQQKEASKIKAGCFDEQNSFVYSTNTHIKYIFLEGKTSGTFKSIEEPLYVSFFMNNQIHAIDRQGEMQVLEVNNTDYLFKLALHRKNLQEVKEILSQGQLCGRSLIAYLKEQGYSEIALFFEKDIKERFKLALQSGNIQVAFEAAQELKEKEYFIKLAQTSVALGNYDITEKCLQQTRQFDKLNFFYAATGSHAKLLKMQVVSGSLDDPMLRYNTSLMTGNVADRIDTLVNSGQLPLAYMSAKAHGLMQLAEQIEQKIQDDPKYDELTIFDEAEKYTQRSQSLIPLRPLHLADQKSYFIQWPMTNLRAKEAENAAKTFEIQKNMAAMKTEDDLFAGEGSSGKGGSQVGISQQSKPAVVEKAEVVIDTNQNWGDDDDDISIEDEIEDNNTQSNENNQEETGASGIYIPPQAGVDPLVEVLRKNPQNVALNVAAGDFSKALELLKNQLAVKNFAPLKQLFVDTQTLSKAKLQPLPHGPSLSIALKASPQLPMLPVTVNTIQQNMNKGLALFTKGAFPDALRVFRQSLQSVPLLALSTQEEASQLKTLLPQIVEYITALRCELERKRLAATNPTENQVRIAELACYMTLCAMEPGHKFLVFKQAMNICYKMQNNITAAHFARAICDLESTGIYANQPETLPKFQKLFKTLQAKGTNAHKLAFSPEDSIQIKQMGITGYLCTGSLTPLKDNRSVTTVKCPLTGSVYEKAQYTGTICETCNLVELGPDCMGLTVALDMPKGAEMDANFANAEFNF